MTDGVVSLAGELERKSMLAVLLPAVRAVNGVIDVEGQLGYAIDDTRLTRPLGLMPASAGSHGDVRPCRSPFRAQHDGRGDSERCCEHRKDQG